MQEIPEYRWHRVNKHEGRVIKIIESEKIQKKKVEENNEPELGTYGTIVKGLIFTSL